MNPIFKLLQSLPTNGWTTAIGGVGLVLLGGGSLATAVFSPEGAAEVCANGTIDPTLALGLITGGLATLGLGNKLEKKQ